MKELQWDVPLIKFQYIGGGGYGQVYKIKQKKLNKLAVKIVQGVGKLDDFDYEAQVRALAKEYAIVSSLDNHPRIVQFFANVRERRTKVRIMIVMEYLEEGFLADRLKDQKPLST